MPGLPGGLHRSGDGTISIRLGGESLAIRFDRNFLCNRVGRRMESGETVDAIEIAGRTQVDSASRLTQSTTGHGSSGHSTDDLQ